MSTIIFIRHGESIANKFKTYGGDYTDSLTDVGKEAATKMANELISKNIAKIITSDSVRAIETAMILNSAINCKIEKWVELNEINCGEFENTEKLKGINIIEKAINSKRGEKFNDLICRAKIAIDKLKSINTNETILVVGHNGFTSVVFFLLNRKNIVSPDNLIEYKKSWKFDNLEIKTFIMNK